MLSQSILSLSITCTYFIKYHANVSLVTYIGNVLRYLVVAERPKIQLGMFLILIIYIDTVKVNITT